MVISYRIADPSSYIAKTGLGVGDVYIGRKAWVLPFQQATKFSVVPQNYSLSLQVMSKEKLEFLLPAVFTVGPDTDDGSLRKYAGLLVDSRGSEHVRELVTGVIEGETRVLAASLTIDEIFKERKFFKEQVVDAVGAELQQFGMKVYNGNIRSLEDSEGSEYFMYLRKKTQENAINAAKVDVAEAQLKGDTGEKERQGQARRQIANVEAETVIYENARAQDVKMAQTDLSVRQAEMDAAVNIAQIRAENEAEMKKAELQRAVEQKRIELETDRQRVALVSKAQAELEAARTAADARLYESQREADAKLYEAEKAAQAQKENASGVCSLVEAFNGDSKSALSYIMMQENLYIRMAETNAQAVRGLEPKITVWNTGGENAGDSMKPIRDVFQTLPPLLATVEEQTGIKPPSWLGKMPAALPGAIYDKDD